MRIRSTPRRAKNSLSRTKFLARRGLPTYLAYANDGGIKCFYMADLENWCFQNGTHTEFINDVYGNKYSLRDMNVERNTYNQNFAFRTKKAALKYLITNKTFKIPLKPISVIFKKKERATK